jgi:hypothetical protein
MAKIHKLEMYIIDCDDRFECLEDILNYIDIKTRETLDMTVFNSQTKEIEWHDDIDLNYFGRSRMTYENYFKE